MSAVLTIGAAMAGIFPSALESQTPKSILSQEEYCRRLQATLVDRNSGTEYLNAISNIQSCQSVAAKSLVAQWNRKQTDPAVLDLDRRMSPIIRHKQHLEVTVRLDLDATLPRNERPAEFAALD
jgi:hypothetical protein